MVPCAIPSEHRFCWHLRCNLLSGGQEAVLGDKGYVGGEFAHEVRRLGGTVTRTKKREPGEGSGRARLS